MAHAAAACGHLSDGFERWELKDKEGRTVAHMAARRGRLSEGFDKWDLANDEGYTVADAAARIRRLPAGYRLQEACRQGRAGRRGRGFFRRQYSLVP